MCLSYFYFLSQRSNWRPSPFSYLSMYFYIFCLDWIFLLLSSSSFTLCFAPEPIYWVFNFGYSVFKRTFRSSKGLWLISPLFRKKNFIISKIMGSETLPYVHLTFFDCIHTHIMPSYFLFILPNSFHSFECSLCHDYSACEWKCGPHLSVPGLFHVTWYPLSPSSTQLLSSLRLKNTPLGTTFPLCIDSVPDGHSWLCSFLLLRIALWWMKACQHPYCQLTLIPSGVCLAVVYSD